MLVELIDKKVADIVADYEIIFIVDKDFGQLIWAGIDWAESHWYLAVPIIGGFLASLFFGIKYMEKRILNERKNRRNACWINR